MPFETAVFDWRAGERRVEESAPDERLAMERVDELAGLYDQGTDWCLDVAQRVAPDAPWAWDAGVVVDAAFHRFLRGATDYAGGRRLYD